MNLKHHICTLVTMLTFTGAFAQPGLSEYKHYGSNPGNLHMYMHIPVSPANNKERRPLLVVLHGCGQTAKTIEQESGWDKLADRFGFYIIYPQQKFLNNAGYCFNWFNKEDIIKNKGEVCSIQQMIGYAIASFPIDSNSIFVYGVSAGAAMAVALMADYPELINAGTIIAGMAFKGSTGTMHNILSMNTTNHNSAKEMAAAVLDQNPGYKGKYPRMFIWHGTTDPVVNINNAHELISQWTDLHHTDEIPDDTIHAFQHLPDITKYIYRDSLNNDVVSFYEINKLGHALLIDPGEPIEKGGKHGLFTVERGIHSTYWIARDMGLIPVPQKE